MCGISGILASQITHQHEQLINKIVVDQFNRGPDFNAVKLIKNNATELLLAHNRLSIIDLSENGNQPMWDATRRFCIVFNGEIYNYIELRRELKNLGYLFNTQSDTEVILNAFAAWGITALSRFHGPFALALYDYHTNELWLCRDRFAVRPLFYCIINNVLYFASTSAVLAKSLNLKPNLAYVAKGLKYLVYEDSSGDTAYTNLFSLSGGNYLRARIASSGQLTTEIKQYYNLADNVQNLIETLPIHNTINLLEKVQHQLHHSINIRLRSDVPLAISLSGGLDSSSVAALVSQKNPNTIGFSFGHPQQKKSEGPLVAKCAKHINIDMKYVWPTDMEMINAFHKTIEVQDAPFASLSIVAQYLLYAKVRDCNIKVLLGGQGGDEAFMGYKKFLLFSLKQSLQTKNYISVFKKLIELLPMLCAEIPSAAAYWQHKNRYRRSQTTHTSCLKLPDAPLLTLGNHHPELWRRQVQDIQQFSLPTLLRYEDRNAMANSVESRLPFMDHQLIELALALPESLKLRSGYGKWAIRKLMANQIPNQIRLARYKRGFDVPLKKLITAGLGNTIRSILLSNLPLLADFVTHPQQIKNFFSDHHLLQNRNVMSEAITLLWLNKTLG